MCATKNSTEEQKDENEEDKKDDSKKKPLNLPLPLLLALMGGGGGLGSLLPLLEPPGKQKADRLKRSDLIEKYGQKVGRFRESTGNIAAIDFGTTFCSLAFTTSSGNIANIKLNEVFPRVPTAILLREREGSIRIASDGLDRTPQYDVYKFGYSAQDEHKKMRKEERARSLYFERFKMDLQMDANVSRNMAIKASNGTEYYLVEVVAFILQYLKNELEKKLSEPGAAECGLSIGEFDWVITVPAIWRSRGKRMMREAAYMAGLCSTEVSISRFVQVGKGLPKPTETNPDRLTLALEPEAAAIYCQTMSAKDVQERCRISGSLKSKRYVVIDIGGGTVDITAHRHDQQKGIEVITEPIGNDCGGMKVNYEFAKLMQKIFRDESSDKNPLRFPRFLNATEPTVVAARRAVVNFLIHKELEDAKAAFGSRASGKPPYKDDDEEVSVKIPFEMGSFYGSEEIEQGVEALNDDRIQLDDDVIYIKYSKMREIFKPAVDGILTCVSSVMEKVKQEIDTFYLVGGFGGCSYIFDQISSLVAEKGSGIQVIVPKDHHLAVSQGAVKYRLNPDVIHSRIMDASYGTSICAPFIPERHSMKYFVGIDSRGIPRRRDVFLYYVERGETMSSDEVVTGELSPMSDAATAMTIDLFSTYDKDVEYIKDEEENSIPSIRKIGEIHVDMPNEEKLPRELRGVEMTMDFSHTEIQVRARYTVNNVEVKATIDFLSDQA